MPEVTFDTIDAIPEGLREGAKQVDGKVVVNVVLKAKLDEFRDNNTTLSQERDTLKASVASLSKLVGEDPEAFQAELEQLRTTSQQVKDGKLKGTDQIEAEVTNRVSSMKTDFERRLQEASRETVTWKEKASAADQKFRRSLIDRAVTNAVLAEASGAQPQALPDILSRSYGVFTVDDNGSLVAKDGEATIYGADGATPMTPAEWLDKLKEQAPYFFKTSNGGGAGGTNANGIPGGMSTEDFNKLSGAQQLALARKQQGRA
ncbi:hypothetical protein HNR26_003857 [Rhizobium rosettiformans]|uniref:Phage protein n=2 Tax=Rhizobium rosettiformans TaxID=1368430 RepID=A0A4S8PRS9_9HYPH|nr:hypothetical protein [Rhizobium rosettiformans]MBB5277768.1 hypothetical protein [Rhizobium rosettiformans]THV32931.1 hypothetical protein FAA86_18750 [Rhizobium rosettiformans W3]